MLQMTAGDLAQRLTLAQIREVEREKLAMLAQQNADAEAKARQTQAEAERAGVELAKLREGIAEDTQAADAHSGEIQTLQSAATRQTFTVTPSMPLGKHGLLKPGSAGWYSWADKVARVVIDNQNAPAHE